MRILYIEDSDIHADMMTRIVQAKGHHMIIATTGAVGLELIRQDPALDLIFIDVGLPDVHGLSLPKAIEKYRPQLPVVAVTAYAMEGDREEALQAGCWDHLAKPFQVDEVWQLLEQYGLTVDHTE